MEETGKSLDERVKAFHEVLKKKDESVYLCFLGAAKLASGKLMDQYEAEQRQVKALLREYEDTFKPELEG